jgi:PAS domain S-box-containing protein
MHGFMVARGKNAMTRKSAVLLVLLIITGFLGNYFAFPLFFGADFLFGSIAVLLVLYFYGLTWGMLAALVAYSYTWVLWGHPYGFVNFMTEALFVGLVLKWDRRNLLLIDGIFWLFLGAPLAWFYYGVALHMDATSATFFMLKQSLNGIFNATLVSLFIYYLPLGKLFQRPQLSTAFSLRDSLFSLLVILVLLPTLLLTILETRKEKKNLEAQVIADLQALSANLQFHLKFWFDHHRQTAQELAKLAAASSRTSTDRLLQYAADVMKPSHKDLLALQVINAAGRTIAFAPEVNAKGESNIGWDFSDRLWFKEFKAKQEPMIGDVLVGKTAFADAPLVLVSAPVFVDNGWAGIACVTLDLTRLQEIIKPYSQVLGQAIITLTDSKGQIVVSTLPGRTAMQIWDWKKTGAFRPLNASMYHWYPDDPKLPSATRWKRSFYVQDISLGPDFPWKLTVEVPVAPLQQTLYSIYVQNLTIMAILTALAMLFSLLLSRWLTKPLVQLSQVTANLPEKLLEVQNLDWPASSTLEINALIDNSKSMAHTIEMNFHNLHTQADELRQVNVDLKREIQERQGAEAELINAKTLMEKTFSSLKDIILVNEPASRNIIAVNQAVEHILGYSPEEVIGQNAEFLHVDRDRYVEFGRRMFSALDQQGFFSIEFPLRSKDGRIIQLEHTITDIKDESGQRILLVGIARDITERKRAEEALMEEAIRRRILVEQSRDGIVVLDQNGKVFEANQRYAELLGYSVEEVSQLYVWDWDSQWTREELLEQIRCVDAHGDHFETRHRRKDGSSIDVEVSTNGVVLRGQKLVFCVCRDISQRKRAEEEILRQREELRGLATRLAEVEESERQQLARELHDDVCQNLTSIALTLETLKLRAQREPLNRFLSKLSDAIDLAGHTSEITRNIMEGLRPTVLDHYGLMGGLRQLGSQFFQRTGIDLEVLGEEANPRLDQRVELALFRIAQEALNNVAKHARASRVVLTQEEDRDTVRLVIADNGTGFDQNLVTKPKEGRGWGLLNIKERAKAVGGHCRIESQPGQGTRVVVEVPR